MPNLRVKRIQLFSIAAFVAATQMSSTFARAQESTNVDVPALIKRLDELEQKVKTLERARETDQQSMQKAATERAAADKVAADRAKTAPTVSIGSSGVQVRSADSNFTMNIRGFAQTDGRFYIGPKSVNDTFLLRRVRPSFEGTVYEKYDYRIVLDLASGVTSAGNNDGFITDAYLNARLWPHAQLQIGKYKAPVGLDRLQSNANGPFVESGLPTQLTPNYDTGIMLHNGLFRNVVDYAVGIFNGVADGGSGDLDSTDEGKEMVARVFTQPFLNSDNNLLRGIGFGVGGSYGYRAGPTRAYTTPGLQTFFAYTNGVTHNGDQYRIAPQAYYYWRQFGIQGEYVLSSHRVNLPAGGGNTLARFNNQAWHVMGSWFITGETNSFRPVAPLHPFRIGASGWGAFELVGRFGQLTLDDDIFPIFASATSARGATSWGVGLNWHLNRNVKLQLDYDQTSFRGGVLTPATSPTARDEHAIFTRAQISF